MSKNNFTGNFAGSAVAGFFIRRFYDQFNYNKMTEDYNKYNLIPDKKSMPVAIFLATVFGSMGLFYASPRVAAGASIIDIPAMLLIVPTFLLRPFIILLAIGAVVSHNQMIDRLFPQERGVT